MELGEPELTGSSAETAAPAGGGASAGRSPSVDRSALADQTTTVDGATRVEQSASGAEAAPADQTTTVDAAPPDQTAPFGAAASTTQPAHTPAIKLDSARLSFGERTLWQGLDLEVAPGEFIAILGPNGSGKTSLLKVLLGQLGLSSGSAEIAGVPARAGHPDIGYIPQQKTIDAGVQLRGTDLVGLGVDGHRWGLGWRTRRERKRKVAAAVADVGAQAFADAPLESMSGGEQQRLRVAQALVGDPRVLLCDEPLLSLDLANQRLVSELIDRRRRTHDTAVLFVTHEINPILPLVDRVLYLVDGKFRIGTPDEVMTSEVLSELYQTEVDVLRVRGRLVVVGTGDTMDALGAAGAHCHGEPGTPHPAPRPRGKETTPAGSGLAATGSAADTPRALGESGHPHTTDGDSASNAGPGSPVRALDGDSEARR